MKLEYKEEVIVTVGENIIATTKIRNDYGASNHSNFQYCDSNIELFSIAPCKAITLNPLCILFGISSLLFKQYRKGAKNQSTKLIQKLKQRD